MSAPLLRPPIPGSGRSPSGSRAPRLGLSIPSPNTPPADAPPQDAAAAPGAVPAPPKPHPPALRINTPLGSNATPQDGPAPRGRLPALQMPKLNTGGATSIQPVDSLGGPGANGNGLNGLKTSQSSDPLSALSAASSNNAGENGAPMEREGSNTGLEADLEKLTLEKGGSLDVDDLDDAAWRAVSNKGMIEELSSLGEGASGAVTRCRLKGGKTVFALKIITTDPNPDVKKQIVRELNVNKNCRSDFICRYYGAFMSDASGSVSIAMECCEGGSLESVYKEVQKLGGRTGEKVLGKVAESSLEGLTYLHKQRIIHRDIKPSNILLCRDGRVKLCDFGVSGESGTKGEANTFIGTSYYMAPERITGQSYTITSDVWSLGVSLLECAQHRFPFPADGTEMQPKAGLIDLLTYIVAQPIPKLKDEPQHGVKWSQNFKYFIECCLERDTKRRATPWRMLDHPWMEDMKTKKVNMEHFLKQVWGWKD